MANSKRVLEDLEAQPAIGSFAELPVETMKSDVLRFTIDEDSPVFETNLGKSWVALVELPQEAAGRGLELKSLCGCLGFRKSIYIPNALVLDDAFRPTKFMDFVAIPPAYDAASYIGKTVIGERDRYLFIYADPAAFDKKADFVTAPYHYTTQEVQGDWIVTTYHTANMSLWWKGAARGDLKVRLIDPPTEGAVIDGAEKD